MLTNVQKKDGSSLYRSQTFRCKCVILVTCSGHLRALYRTEIFSLQVEALIMTISFSLSSLQSKRIAGRIIPAIATTTAAVAGLMCLELFKLVQGHKKISSYRTAYLNLAVQYIVLSQPCRPPSFEVSSCFFLNCSNQAQAKAAGCSEKKDL